MHMLEHFLFVVHSSGDFKRGRVFLMAHGDDVSNELERGKRLFINGQFLSNFWNDIHCRFFCNIFGDFF